MGRRVFRSGLVAVAGAAASLALVAAAQAGSSSPGQYFTADARAHTAHLTLLAGLGDGNGGYNFDGYGRGELQVSVPLGWRLSIDCDNRSGSRASCTVIRDALATTPAFPGATSPSPVLGLNPGSTAAFSFKLTRSGTFRIASLVPGEEQARMWDVLEVTRGGKPTISARPGP
jgi:hypothetical protein